MRKNAVKWLVMGAGFIISAAGLSVVTSHPIIGFEVFMAGLGLSMVSLALFQTSVR